MDSTAEELMRSTAASRSLVIRNVTALAGRELRLEKGTDISISSGRIDGSGTGRTESDSVVIDGSNLLAIPGLVNGHIHLNDAPLKDLGIGGDLDSIVHPVTGIKRTGLADMSTDSRLAAMESALSGMVSSGTTTAVNFHEEGPEILKALAKRTAFSAILLNLGRPAAYSSFADIERNSGFAAQALDAFSGELVNYDGTGLSGANEYSDRALEQVAAVRAGVRAVHAAESERTVLASMRMTGKSEVERLIRHFSPNFIVHMTHATGEDIKRVASGGTSVVCCPRSNGILGAGIPRVGELLKSGINVGIGTDNLMLNSPDMFREMDFTSRLIRGTAESPSAVDSITVLAMATEKGAAAVGLGSRTGAIEPGLDGDIALIDLHGSLAGTRDIYSSVVHRAMPSDVAGTIKKGVLLHADSRIRRAE